jgi:hypothetical protein
MSKKSKIIVFHTLLYRTYMMAFKKDMLKSYGVKSTKDLTEYQLDELIVTLQDLEKSKRKPETEETKAWRHKVLRVIAQCGINTQDWNEVNAFVCQPRIAGKHLYKCTIDELKTLHRKLHNVAKEKEKQNQKLRMQAMMN